MLSKFRGGFVMPITVEETINTRSDKAISSYVTENEFKSRFLMSEFLTYTEGWWFGLSRRQRKKYFFVRKNELGDLDNEIITILKNNNYKNVFQVRLDNRHITIIDPMDGYVWEIDEFLQDNYEFIRRGEMQEPSCMNQITRKKREHYYNYLVEHAIDEGVRESIFVENKFLNKYFNITNIDFIIKNKGGLLVIELKCKYPDLHKMYGINIEQYDLLKLLNEAGLTPINIILKNDERKDVLELCGNEGHYIYKKVRFNLNRSAVRTAPSYTGYAQNRNQQYYPVSANAYIELKDNNNILDWRCPECGSEMMMRKGPYSTFWGCSNYKDTGCKGNRQLLRN